MQSVWINLLPIFFIINKLRKISVTLNAWPRKAICC
jgi:hypothetical protein